MTPTEGKCLVNRVNSARTLHEPTVTLPRLGLTYTRMICGSLARSDDLESERLYWLLDDIAEARGVAALGTRLVLSSAHRQQGKQGNNTQQVVMQPRTLGEDTSKQGRTSLPPV